MEGGKWGLADSVRMTSFGALVTGSASLSSYHLTTILEQPIRHCASRIKSNVALSIKEVLKNKASHTLLQYTKDRLTEGQYNIVGLIMRKSRFWALLFGLTHCSIELNGTELA